ncbi:hypothetical protein [Pseudomonas vranovensis]|uniref:Uncharacterized protein n=1 Tax=Pseudomonas vranovensis TaxID=321661 RepID=A0A423CYY1_9PSED|nr:hypothetical protein [Pseudomonas vranovensis]ROL64575.1 hypothetical protein BHU25_22100 [Pseudomonas vranovensis]
MPTENRSSNTEQMVSVPMSTLEKCLRDANLVRFTCDKHVLLLQDLLSQSAAQHQDEPVAWVIFDNGFIDDHTTDKDLADGWCEQGLEVSALYTHADAGEVERLRNELAGTVAECQRRRNSCADLIAECDTLRAQLAEQNALLRGTSLMLKSIAHKLDGFHRDFPGQWCGYLDRALGGAKHQYGVIEAALSASAEQSAPVERGPWQPITAPGQVQEGDWLSFTVAGGFICAQARLIINPGTPREEIIYNRQKNHYFVTSMAIDGTSTHKGVLVAKAQV